MPGTVANPVRLQNVFRKIVEVHWNPARFLTFQINATRTNTGAFGDALACGGPDGTEIPPEPPGDWTNDDRIESTYMVSAVVDYVSGGYSGFKLLRNNAWQTLSGGSVTLTGLPSDIPQTFSYAFEAVPYQNRIGPDSRSLWPRGRWDDASGSDITYAFNGDTVPVVTPTGSLNFRSDLATAFEIYGNVWTDAMDCYDLRALTGGAALNRVGRRTDDYNHVLSSQSVSLSGIAVVYQGKTYAPVGFRYEADSNTVPVTAGILHVLCDREAASG